MMRHLAPLLLALLSCCIVGADATSGNGSPTRHTIETEKDVKLEVLEWAGPGIPIILLHGAGCTADIYRPLAERLAQTHRIIAITRRGAGTSSMPASGYSDAHFGKDTLAVIEALGLGRPLVVGHSMAGSEISWLNQNARSKFSGFVYLDALAPTAYYSELSNDPGYLPFSVLDTVDRLNRLIPGSGEGHPRRVAQELGTTLPQLQVSLKEWLRMMEGFPEPTPEDMQAAPPYLQELSRSIQKYTKLSGRILAFFPVPEGYVKAIPRATPPPHSLNQMEAFAYETPSAKVITVEGADHFVFVSHEDIVVSEITKFVEELGGAQRFQSSETHDEPID